MNWKFLLPQALQLINELSKADLPGKEKLARLTTLVSDFLETADDVVELLPWGFAWLAKIIVDSDAVNALQREKIAVPLAEMLYQIWKGITSSGGNVETFLESGGAE